MQKVILYYKFVPVKDSEMTRRWQRELCLRLNLKGRIIISEHGVVFFDGRNAYEAKVGKFKNAVVPETETTRDFVEELESDKYDDIKDKPVVTYCTGGIRCEILSLLMKNRGFKDVYQMDGGIVKYGEKYGDDGLWEGNLYIFDGRMNHKFSDKAKDIGICIGCGGKTSNYENCDDKTCDCLMLLCKKCAAKSLNCKTYNTASVSN
jgi:UPF0176 protein